MASVKAALPVLLLVATLLPLPTASAFECGSDAGSVVNQAQACKDDVEEAVRNLDPDAVIDDLQERLSELACRVLCP